MKSLAFPGGIVARSLTAADAPAFYTTVDENRAHLNRWLRWSSGIRSTADAERFIADFTRKEEQGDGFHLGLWEGKQLAGGVVCWYIHRENRNAEIGYWLATPFLGRGLATAAARALTDYLFDVEDVHRIEMLCGVENTDSRAIPERLGYRLEGVKRESHWITNRFLDHAVYGLLRREWEAVRSEE